MSIELTTVDIPSEVTNAFEIQRLVDKAYQVATKHHKEGTYRLNKEGTYRLIGLTAMACMPGHSIQIWWECTE